jgi:hypothetical protein
MLDALALNHEGIAYYANSVIKSEIFQLARRDQEDRYLHLVAFIAHQCSISKVEPGWRSYGDESGPWGAKDQDLNSSKTVCLF